MNSTDSPGRPSDLIYKWISSHFGHAGILAAGIIVALSIALLNWAKIRDAPGIKQVLLFVGRRPISKTSLSRFSILVADLEGDDDRHVKQQIIESLKELRVVDVLALDKRIDFNVADNLKAEVGCHILARKILTKKTKDVLIWGIVLKSHGKQVPKLFWTAQQEVKLSKDYERYPIVAEDLKLPELFADDLFDVLRLMVLGKAALLNPFGGQFNGGPMLEYIGRTESVVNSLPSNLHPKDRVALHAIFATALCTYGAEVGDKARIENGITFFESALELESKSNNSTTANWVGLQNNLGVALYVLGKNQDDVGILKKARKALEAALSFWNLEHSTTVKRQAILSNLGNALVALGERETGTQTSEEALTTIRMALRETDKATSVVDWIGLQNNLSVALLSLGLRQSGTDHLAESVDVARTALAECHRKRWPHMWAATINNLASSLRSLGERENSSQALQGAIAACRESLLERKQEKVPMAWAETQTNLGIALRLLGAREQRIGMLEDSVAAFRAALLENTRERVPVRWAATQDSLGVTLSSLGELASSTAYIEEAIIAFRLALEVRTQDRLPVDWTSTQNNLGGALTHLGDREFNNLHLREAVAAYQSILLVNTREKEPLMWATACANLANALRNLSVREESSEGLAEAVRTYRSALEEITREKNPFNWAIIQFHLALALTTVEKLNPSLALFEESLTCYLNAASELKLSNRHGTEMKGHLDSSLTVYGDRWGHDRLDGWVQTNLPVLREIFGANYEGPSVIGTLTPPE